jgi:2-dehydro-3-deoxygalactonokinase
MTRPMPLPPPALISVDWGTSSFRAFMASEDGAVLDRVESDRGILTVAPGGHEKVLSDAVGKWRSQNPAPIVMSGMIGARQGWVEAPYASCPANLCDVAAAMATIPTQELGNILVVPGLSFIDAHGAPDVMRGEETQIFGALAAMQAQDGLFVLPGTHSKWARVEAGRIIAFATYMTGEVFAVLKTHSILGRLMGAGEDLGEGFDDGVRAAARLERPGDLLHAIFMTRTLGLFDSLSAAKLPDYLSGLLIGAEIAAAAHGAKQAIVVGAPNLTRRYQQAGRLLGATFAPAPDHCALRGQIALLAARSNAAA